MYGTTPTRVSSQPSSDTCRDTSTDFLPPLCCDVADTGHKALMPGATTTHPGIVTAPHRRRATRRSRSTPIVYCSLQRARRGAPCLLLQCRYWLGLQTPKRRLVQESKVLLVLLHQVSNPIYTLHYNKWCSTCTDTTDPYGITLYLNSCKNTARPPPALASTEPAPLRSGGHASTMRTLGSLVKRPKMVRFQPSLRQVS